VLSTNSVQGGEAMTQKRLEIEGRSRRAGGVHFAALDER